MRASTNAPRDRWAILDRNGTAGQDAASPREHSPTERVRCRSIRHVLSLCDQPPRRGRRSPTRDDAGEIRAAAKEIRRRLRAAVTRFGVKRARPGWRQRITAELSTLWVVLENAMPKRMKGYGRDFKPQDQLDWECLIRDLLRDVDRMRDTTPPNKGGL